MFICISGTSGSVNTFQHREPEEESDSDSDDDLARVRKRMRLENLIKHVDADVARELTAEIVNIFKEVKSTVATEIESLHEKVDALQNQMKEVREGVKWIGSKLKKKNGGIEQGNDAQQPEQEGQAIAPEPVAENVPQPARLNVEENAAVHNPREPRYITGGQCNDDQFLLGGRIGFVRSRQDYSELLHNVTKSGPYRDENERGKTLCLHLVRREFSNESLATKNATGQTKENRRTVAYPKLNEEVMRAIFDQARLQVTGFTVCLTVPIQQQKQSITFAKKNVVRELLLMRVCNKIMRTISPNKSNKMTNKNRNTCTITINPDRKLMTTRGETKITSRVILGTGQ